MSRGRVGWSGAPAGGRPAEPAARRRVEPDEGGTQYRRGVEADEDGAWRGGVDAGGDAGVEGGVAGVEDAATEHDLDRFVLEVEPDDGGADEGHDLVGQDVGRRAGGGVTVGRRIEEDAGKLEEPVVGDGAGVDAGQRGLGIGHTELGRHPLAEHGGGAPAVAGAEGEAEGAHAEPGAAGREVSRQLRQRGEAHGPAVGPDGGAVHAGAADDADAPGAVVPARETANVSLRRITRSVHPMASIAGASFSSSTGRSMPARQ